MYTIEEIEKDIEKCFKNHEMGNVVEDLQRDCREIVESLDINNACERIFTIRKLYHNTQQLPKWFKKLVFLTIYNYLYPIYFEEEKAKYQNGNSSDSRLDKKKHKNQSELLNMMGLVNDIICFQML